MNEDKLNILARTIIYEFELILNYNGIKLPDQFREGEEDEACIYGETYYTLEDNIVQILKDNKDVL
jgi:hypothetical protein